ncbi:hypothetical protein GCM10022234_36020 [Aeromicrobium panaciterrae]|uniref:hypothetical protein n=1 Tax=Aeromicrobium panaciterrae TaxID=363861 RepID=UPI0031CE5703
MAAHKQQSPGSRALGVWDEELDPESPEFLDECLALIKKSTARQASAAVEAGRTPAETADARREADDARRVVGQLEAHISELRTALADAQAQIRDSAATLRDQESLQQTIAGVMTERDADLAELREARRREAQAHTELLTVRTELTNIKAHYNDTTAALAAASDRATQARAEFDRAREVISQHDEEVSELRQVIGRQEREIEQLQQQLRQSDDARTADAHLRDVIERQEREIAELQLLLLQSEEARAADAASFVQSLDALKS